MYGSTAAKARSLRVQIRKADSVLFDLKLNLDRNGYLDPIFDAALEERHHLAVNMEQFRKENEKAVAQLFAPQWNEENLQAERNAAEEEAYAVEYVINAAANQEQETNHEAVNQEQKANQDPDDIDAILIDIEAFGDDKAAVGDGDEGYAAEYEAYAAAKARALRSLIRKADSVLFDLNHNRNGYHDPIFGAVLEERHHLAVNMEQFRKENEKSFASLFAAQWNEEDLPTKGKAADFEAYVAGEDVDAENQEHEADMDAFPNDIDELGDDNAAAGDDEYEAEAYAAYQAEADIEAFLNDIEELGDDNAGGGGDEYAAGYEAEDEVNQEPEDNAALPIDIGNVRRNDEDINFLKQ